MEFLTPAIGETASRIVIIALVVLLLGALSLLLIGLAMRVFNGRSLRSRRSEERAPRLAIPDALTVDSRRKLVLIRRDNVEHLVMIGGGTDFVVEPAIQRFLPNSRSRVPAGAQPEASSPQPAAMPPLSGSIGPGRPLAARSRGAVQAGQHPGAEQRAAGSRTPDNAPPPAAREPAIAEDKEIARAAEKSPPPKPTPAMAARPEPAPEAPPSIRPASPISPPARPAPTAATAARPANSERPRPGAAPPNQRAPEPVAPSPEAARPPPASAATRPASRPTAAAKPPAGHPSAEPPPADRPSQPGEGPAEPLPRPAATARSEPKRGKPAGLGEDTDMTALLGEIFGQNKH